MRRRNLILGAALLVTVAWSAWTLVAPAPEDVDVVQARVRSPAAGTASAASAGSGARPLRADAGEALAPPAPLQLPQRPAAPSNERNLFGAYSYQAPAPKLAAAAPAPVQAPPLPFRFTGQLIVDGKATYLLLQGDEPVGVTVGASVGEFQLVSADDRQLVFQYGPTGQRVPMSIASTAIN
jgi:hypothetical protein